MMKKELVCELCSARLTAMDWARHQKRFHPDGKAGIWHCVLCSYQSTFVADALCHGLLEGHRLKSREKWTLKWPRTAPANFHSASVTATYDDEDCQEDEKIVLPIDDYCEVEERSEKVGSTFSEGEEDEDAEEAEVEQRRSNTSSTNDIRPGSPEKADSKQGLTCKNCAKFLSFSQRGNLFSCALSHVKACLQVRPYACSSCRYLSSEKSVVKKHVQNKCRNGSVELVDREQNENAIRSGLSTCFPDHVRHWRGLS